MKYFLIVPEKTGMKPSYKLIPDTNKHVSFETEGPEVVLLNDFKALKAHLKRQA